MSGFVKKLMATGAALTLGVFSVAFADFYYDHPGHTGFDGHPGFDSSCCPRFDSCCGNWCENISFNAAWLYWRLTGDELDYAVERRSFFPNIGAGEQRERHHDIKGDFDSGYRIGLDFDLPCRGWGVSVQWTHLDTTSSSHKLVPGRESNDESGEVRTAVAFPFFFFSSTDIGNDDEAHFFGKFKLRYNIVDLEFGKWCCCGDGVMFRPHVGFRFADIKERFHDTLELKGDADIEGFQLLGMRYRDEFKGAGIRVGLNADYRICDGWSIFGKGAFSTVWGTTHIKQREILGESDVEINNRLFVHESHHSLRFFTDLEIGLQWRTMACDCYPFTIEFAWEHHFLLGQHRPWSDNEFDVDNDANTSFKKKGDVGLQGFTLNVAFDF